MPTEDEVIAVLKEIVDPHTNMNVYEMGLISEIVSTDDSVSLTFRPTSQFCPLGVHLALNIKRRLVGLDGVKKAEVNVVGHVHQESINEEVSAA
jgi:metal-sulfur cluster biosynthetic enzyme